MHLFKIEAGFDEQRIPILKLEICFKKMRKQKIAVTIQTESKFTSPSLNMYVQLKLLKMEVK